MVQTAALASYLLWFFPGFFQTHLSTVVVASTTCSLTICLSYLYSDPVYAGSVRVGDPVYAGYRLQKVILYMRGKLPPNHTILWISRKMAMT